MKRSIMWASILVLILSAMAVAQTPSRTIITGMMITDGVTGQKAAPHGWLKQQFYAASLETGIGIATETSENPQGQFNIPGDNKEFLGLSAGRAALFTLSFDGTPAFSIRTDVKIPKDTKAPVKADLNTPASYSVMYNNNPSEWGTSPYVDGTDFYQTFIATTPHITRLAVKLGGKSGDHLALTLNHAIYEANDGPPSTWKRISPVRQVTYASRMDPIIVIFHVQYRSNEVNLVPGKKYAARFWREPSSPSPSFLMVVRSDKGDGYSGGQLYNGDKAMPEYDAYAYISGGQQGTVVNHAPVGDLELKQFAGSGQLFGQTFKASGTSLAGMDVVYTDGTIRPASLPIKFQVYDAPGGKPIGPIRICYANPLTYQGRAAAAWERGEVPLIPGNMYYVEWSAPKVVNTWVLNEDLPGMSYVDGKAQPKTDLALSIAEYVGEK